MELRSLNLSKLLKGLCELPSVLDCRVHGLTLDSRQVKRGDAFVALRGRSVDGTQYISDAIARGAVVIFRECAPGQSAGQVIEQGTVIEVHLPDLAGHLGVLSSRFYGDPSEMLQVIGVTGTNGKSSVSHFLAQVLCEAGFNTGVIGTLGYGFVDRLIPASHTTPDVLRTQSLLASLCAQQADAVVMEVSSHGLDQGRVDSVNIEGAIFTNLTRDHLDYHETMEAYGDAKRRLFERPELRFAVVNVDDAFGRVLQSRMAPGVALFTYGISSPAMISVIHVEYLAEGIHAEIATPLGRLRLESGLIGAFNLSNLLAVVAAAIAMGVEIKPLEKALTKLHPVLGRMQRIARPGQAAVVIDYAHTPDALDSALTALRPHTKGKIWCVFGCGGDRDTGKRALMGAIAEQKADVVIITNDNPRSEPSQQIIDHILSGLDVPENAIVEPDREKAIRYVVERAAHQDLILLAGKGHEDYQEVDGVRLPYSDIKVVQTIFGLGGAIVIGSVSLTTIARVTGGKLVGSDVVFDSVSTDSRTIQPGELFIALSGPSYEGDRFVAGAHASGAIAAVVRRLQEVALSQVQVEDTQLALVQVAQMNRRAFEGTVVAITGSSGKTTVKELVAHLLAGQGETLATKGNLNNLIGVPMTLTRIDASHRFAVIELGASALGEIAQTAAWTQPDIAVITNAGNAHLGGFGSLENIVRAKGEIIDSLAADGVAVLNADDLAFPLWKTRAKARKVVSFSASGVISADVYAKDIRLGDGAEFLLCSGDENYLVQLPLQGKQNVANALAASAVALECGMSLSVIARRLATAPRVKGRLESVMFSSGMRLINDSYNANPASVKAAMDVIAPLPGHRIAVLGDMAELGADAVALHREVGAYAKALRLDELYLTGNYANDVAQGFGAGAQCFPDKASLISAIKKVSQANLTLLVKGSRSAAMEDVVNELTQTNKVVQSC